MNIVFVTTGLQTGGAEKMLVKLLERLDRASFSPRVISLTTEGDLGVRIRELGVPLYAIGMRPGRLDMGAVWQLRSLLHSISPGIVQTWMYHADFVGGLAARMAQVPTVVWSIRNSDLPRDKTKLATRGVVGLCALFSRWVPTGIISCSETARDIHVARGYSSRKMTVIPNGFNLEHFTPNLNARVSLRGELGLPFDTPLIGIVGRYDPQKNHVGFVAAAGMLRRSRPDVHFVLVGRGLDRENVALRDAADAVGVADRMHWLGQRADVHRLMAAFDFLASASSFGEAFPNVLGEAMACGVPCVVTDVGDSAAIVGDTGAVVRPGDMEGLAAELAALLAEDPGTRANRAASARRRVQERYEIGQIVHRYEAYYKQLSNII